MYMFAAYFFSHGNNMFRALRFNSKVLELFGQSQEADRPEKVAPRCGWDSPDWSSEFPPCTDLPLQHSPRILGSQRKKPPPPPRRRRSVHSCVPALLSPTGSNVSLALPSPATLITAPLAPHPTRHSLYLGNERALLMRGHKRQASKECQRVWNKVLRSRKNIWEKMPNN